MINPLCRIHRRAHRRGPHGHRRISRQRLIALLMIITGLARAVCWVTLIALYLLGAPFTKTLFASVAFVAVISLYANAATDWGQVAASLAALTAGDAHQAAEDAQHAAPYGRRHAGEQVGTTTSDEGGSW